MANIYVMDAVLSIAFMNKIKRKNYTHLAILRDQRKFCLGCKPSAYLEILEENRVILESDFRIQQLADFLSI